jgi:hypothetical protein
VLVADYAPIAQEEGSSKESETLAATGCPNPRSERKLPCVRC